MPNVVGNTKFQMAKTELYVPIKNADNNKLKELLGISFNRSIFWNEYKSKIQTITQAQNDNNFKRILLDSSYSGVNRLFAMGSSNNNDNSRVERDSHRKYSLPRVDIKDYNALIDGRNFYDQSINDELRKYDEVRNIMIGRGEDYETGSWLGYAYYKKDKLIACDLSKQKILDSDPKSIQQIELIFKLDNTNDNTAQILTALEK